MSWQTSHFNSLVVTPTQARFDSADSAAASPSLLSMFSKTSHAGTIGAAAAGASLRLLPMTLLCCFAGARGKRNASNLTQCQWGNQDLKVLAPRTLTEHHSCTKIALTMDVSTGGCPAKASSNSEGPQKHWRFHSACQPLSESSFSGRDTTQMWDVVDTQETQLFSVCSGLCCSNVLAQANPLCGKSPFFNAFMTRVLSTAAAKTHSGPGPCEWDR